MSIQYPHVRIGTPTLSLASECVPPPPRNQRGGHTHRRVRGWGSQFGRLEEKPSTLSTLCLILSGTFYYVARSLAHIVAKPWLRGFLCCMLSLLWYIICHLNIVSTVSTNCILIRLLQLQIQHSQKVWIRILRYIENASFYRKILVCKTFLICI